MLEENRNPSSTGWWRRMRRAIDKPEAMTTAPAQEEAPVIEPAKEGSELFSIEQLRTHFRTLAEHHRLSEGRQRTDPLLRRLDKNARIMGEVYQRIAHAAANKERLAPAAEWLLDNNYLITEQIRTARRHFPRSYNRELPKLANGPLAGYARTYVLAWQLIKHVDARIDSGSLGAAISAYQETNPLTLGELWSIPIMLRLALIENLRQVALRIDHGREETEQAERWADRLLQLAEHRPTELVVGIAELSRKHQQLADAFIADLSRRIQGRHHGMGLVLSWIEQRLGEQGVTVETMVQRYNQTQAADQVSVGHAITSLRFIGAVDWREFVETQSRVEQDLRADPLGTYGHMEFGTRDRYRHVIERIAKHSPLSEHEVAQLAVAMAGKASAAADDGRQRHVGWWLLGAGLPELEAAATMRRGALQGMARGARRHALALYLLIIIASSLLVGEGAYLMLGRHGVTPLAAVALALVTAFLTSQTVTGLVQWLCSLAIQPTSLPRLDFRGGIPKEARSLVVVPCLVTDAHGVDEMLERLEVRWVGNRDPQSSFMLLSDYADHAAQHAPGDQALLERLRAGITALNQRWGTPDHPQVFALFHRERTWNAQDRVWMGWERKRGKLLQLNHALRRPWPEGVPSGFSTVIADATWLRAVRYIVVLDADTMLPMDAVKSLAAAMMHPLNRPLHDPATNLVVAGHGLLQPRVAVSLPSAGRSVWARVCAVDPGLDPYSRAVSDFYQDVFDQGSFIGKGIYDLDAFERSLQGRTPERAILSHDLLEGSYVRAGLLSDVMLYEDTPARYLTDAARRHRWIRGDWQLLPWLTSWVPRSHGPRERNPLDFLAQWKLLDNVRRSLVPAATILWLACCWLVPARGWMALPLAMWVVSPVLSLGRELTARDPEMTWPRHLRQVARSALSHLEWLVLSVVMVAHEASYAVDAILRAIWRITVSHRHLLEWKTAAAAERESRLSLYGAYAAMFSAPLLGVVLFAAVLALHPGSASIAGLFCGAWVVSPGVAWLISRPRHEAGRDLGVEDQQWLRTRARRTWRWFETFLQTEHHFLPPDNFQEHPVAVIAPRTSPTNVGMGLLCELAAHDFGWITSAGVLEHCTRTVTTLESMERYRGHFFNWYDTTTLQALPPRYVSTVDSGNFVGALLVMIRGVEELAQEPLVSPHIMNALIDTLHNLIEASGGRADAAVQALIRRLPPAPLNAPQAVEGCNQVLMAIPELRRLAVGDDGQWWVGAVERQAHAWLQELGLIGPWLSWSSGARGDLPAGLFTARASLQDICDAGAALARRPAVASTALVGAQQEQLSAQCQATLATAQTRITQLRALAQRLRGLAEADFSFLYDRERELFSIGYNVADHRLDGNFYDLLASEARLISYVAVAQGQVSQEHWFTLGRLLTTAGGEAALLSWSGSMFEYLMPLLVMPNHPDTLLDRTYHAVIHRQMSYAAEQHLPWGISESGYNATDASLNYQYRAFGVPGMGLKRGLGDDRVIAPYATAMAVMVEPQRAVDNLRRLAKQGFEGRYGFFEAVDYTPSRVPPGQSFAIIRSWMAHHQGMALLSFTYALLGQPMQRRFLADPVLRGSDLLLHEKVPKARSPIVPHADEGETRRGSAVQEPVLRVFNSPATATPEVHLLSNGRYHVMLSASGAGYSRWRDLAVTRWREDWTRDSYGQFCFLRDVDSSAWWSTAYQPTNTVPTRYEAVFTQGRAEFKRTEGGIDSYLEIAVSPEDDVEVRRVTISNNGDATRLIEATSYGEVVLAGLAQDLAHPAFSNLFVRTELVPERGAILVTRRARAADEHPPWAFHLIAVVGIEVGACSFETSRPRFIGHGRSLTSPQAMERERLSGSSGSVLDPIMAVRRTLRLAPEAKARFDIVTGVAETREQALALIERYSEQRIAERVFEMAWTHSQVLLRQLGADEATAQLFGRLAGSVIYPAAVRRAQAGLIAQNRRGQAGLWGYGISGDLPIVALRIADPDRLDLVTELAQAHGYWRAKGLISDLVILVEDRSVYRKPLHEEVLARISATPGAALDRPGGVFVRRWDQIAEEDRILLQAAARVVIQDTGGTLSEQLERKQRPDQLPPRLVPRLRPPLDEKDVAPPERALIFDNGIGGFTSDGREYVMTLGPGRTTPTAWSNVMANERFGTVVDEGGGAYTWAENCHEFRLTAWHNDPVTGSGGEAFYLRDEETASVWSPMPWPSNAGGWYVARHGFGYSAWEHTRHGISSETMAFVSSDSPVKLVRIRITNRSERSRQLVVAGYWELVLGELRHKSAPHIVTTVDGRSGALLASNTYNTDFGGRVVFLDCLGMDRSYTGDRLEFLGRNAAYGNPRALARTRLSNRVGAGLDPCFGVMSSLTLEPGESREVTYVLGCGTDQAQAAELIERFRRQGAVADALAAVWAFWKDTLGVIHLETPDPAVNIMANGWLVYQVLASRFWARSGFFQSGGAYGFRDQLQDVMALIHAAPGLARAHLLRAAAHQFTAGDVLHWWHPPQDKGVRTHFSDDYLWLPWATARYVETTGDTGILDERAAFLEGRPLLPEEEARYDSWSRAAHDGTLYDHCLRAIRWGLRFGVHGMPLIGCGDWNDGMNRIGMGGKGESVWLAFFLCDVLGHFSALCTRHQDPGTAQEFASLRTQLAERIDAQAWDGDWYTRAWFDDGTPLGTKANAECQIDSLPQSWAALSGATDPARAVKAMDAVQTRLVDTQAGLIKLFDPPFDSGTLDPGYIKGYLPGVRENGGQYTHAAVWVAMATAELGQVERAWELTRALLPITHGGTPSGIRRYQAEPYVVAADVYGVAPHVGRGGWSWYTGSAGWMYRLLVESLVGIHLLDGRLTFKPRLPADWTTCRYHYRFGTTFYHVELLREGAAGSLQVSCDGQLQAGNAISLADDHQEHQVVVRYG